VNLDALNFLSLIDLDFVVFVHLVGVGSLENPRCLVCHAFLRIFACSSSNASMNSGRTRFMASSFLSFSVVMEYPSFAL